jgi:hypothetical protein
MKEKILAPPVSCEMATALFDIGAGSGLNLGVSAARRQAGDKMQNNIVTNLWAADFIAEMIAVKVLKPLSYSVGISTNPGAPHG